MNFLSAIARRFALRILLSMNVVGVLADVSAAQAVDAAADPAQQQQQIDARELLEKGQAALDAGEFDAALEAYDTVIVNFKNRSDFAPYLPGVYTNRGRAFLGLEDVESALADFNAAVEADAFETYWPVRIFRGNLYLEVHQPSAALPDFQKAVELQRRSIEALFGLGKSYVLLGGSQQAMRPLTYVLSAPDDNEAANAVRAEAYRLRAQANAGMGEFEDAHADVESALAIDPENYESYFVLGAVYILEEKHAEAVQAFAEAIQRYVPKDPTTDEPYIQGYLTRAATLMEVGKLAEDEAAKQEANQAALADCDTLLELLGEKPIYAQARAATEFRRGVALRMMGQLGDAINALTEAINLNPDLAEAYFRRGICFYYIGEDKLAVADFQKAASIAYDDPRIRLWEGFTFARMENPWEAVRAYGQAIAESDRYVQAFVNRGLTYMSIEDYEKAIDDFDEAIRLEPTVASHYFKRGVAYERLGDSERAAGSFTNAIRFDEDFAPAYRHAADALAALGRDELAGQYRSKAAELDAAQQ